MNDHTLHGGPQDDSGETRGGTVRINMEGFESADANAARDDRPIDAESLGTDRDDVLSLLTPKPPEKYIFRKSIGRGGMKMVIQVKDRDTMRDVAMAVFPDAANRPAAETRRFIEEARITASLEHPNIVPVHDIGVDASGSPYFTMKLLRGETLASILKKLDAGDPDYKKLYPLEPLLRIFIKVCNAVAFSHSKGVIHLDLKPGNIQVGDFGEVLLMDFGLAKVVSGSRVEKEDVRNEKLPSRTVPGVTLDGITKGTPGYMAPEQAAGKNSQKDFRTDIYALGAILYAIVTCRNPLAERSDMKQMMLDTVKGRIIPPRERTPERLIPYTLEAVILKAMSVRPGNRYQTVEALRDEVKAFLDGFATQAEKAGPIKRTLLFIRRNRIAFPAIALSIFLLLGISFYAMEESSRQKSLWIELYSDNYADGRISADLCSFYNSTIYTSVPKWRFTADGLSMQNGEWMFLDGMKLTGGVKAEISFIPAKGNSFSVAVNTGAKPMNYSWEHPSGYTFVFSGLGGSMDMIFKKTGAGTETVLASGETSVIPDKLNSVVVERNNERFVVTVNGKKTLEATDLFPHSSSNPGQIGIRSDGQSTILKTVRLYRLALPEKASPLIAGDVLLERKHYAEAAEQYLTIADSYASGPIPDAALARAYYTAATFIQDKAGRDHIMNAVREKIHPALDSYEYSEQILEMDALTFWKDGDYRRSLDTVNRIFRKNPSSEIMSKILQLPHRKLPHDETEALLDNIVRNRRLKRLDLSGFGISSLKKLRRMGLSYLDCSDNQLTSLEGLENMPLESLDCSNNLISSLEPIRYIPLRTLVCAGNRLSTLEPLNMSSLKSLDASRNQLVSLESVSGKSLERLSIRENRIASLSPLYGMALKLLDAGQNPFNTLTPLCGMPLEILFLDNSGISNLNPIKDMRLNTLSLYNCGQLTDLSPIFGMDSLQMLSLPPNPDDIEPLKAMPGLIFLTDKEILPRSEGSETAAAFWERYTGK